MAEEIESELGLREQEIPKIFWEIFIDSSKDGKKVILEGANGTLSSVLSMHIGRDTLVRCLPFNLNDTFVFSANFVVEDLEVDFVAAGAETIHDGVVCCDAILVFFSFEGSNKDGVGITMIGSHDVLVAAVRSKGEAASIVGVEF